MDGIDYQPSAAFLAAFFGPVTNHAVEIRALPQEQGNGPARPRFTRDAQIIRDHLERWDQPGRAVYFGVATRLTGKPTGRRADLAELPALWVDIDCDKQGIARDDAVAAALSLPLRPSLLVNSRRRHPLLLAPGPSNRCLLRHTDPARAARRGHHRRPQTTRRRPGGRSRRLRSRAHHAPARHP